MSKITKTDRGNTKADIWEAHRTGIDLEGFGPIMSRPTVLLQSCM